MTIPHTTKVVGVTHGDAQKNIKRFGCSDIGSYALIREPENPFDPNAIRVSLCGVFEMGYICREVAKELAPLMDNGRRFLAEFVHRNQSPFHDTVGLTIRIVETTNDVDFKGE